MKFLKWLLIIVGIIAVVTLIYGATQPSQMEVEESIVIDAPATMVFAEIKDFSAWDDWSAWSKMDPEMAQTYSGDVGTVGYSNSWDSDKFMVGKGSQEIIEIRENEYLKTKMLFNGEGAENFASFTLTEEKGKTTVVWDMLGSEKPFYLKFMDGLFKPQIIKSYQTSLKDLKIIVENKPVVVANPMNLEVVEVAGDKIISIRDTTNAAGISDKLAELYTEMSIFLSVQEGVEMAGMPIGIYHMYSEETVDMEAAFLITGDAQNSGRIVVGELPQGKALKGVHLGDYEASGTMHMAMEEYVKANSAIEFEGICWEIYANDPTMVDSADVKTEIYYQLK